MPLITFAGVTRMDDIGKPSSGFVEDLLLKDPKKLTQPIKDIKEKYELLPAFLKVSRSFCRAETSWIDEMIGHNVRSDQGLFPIM